MLPGPINIHEVDIKEAQKLLFILTGFEPVKTVGKIDKYHQGEHLRFVFDGKSASFTLVKTMLKLLDIQHCSELFKNLEPREGKPTLEFYITVAKAQFAKLYGYFAPGAFVTLNMSRQTMQVAELSPQIQSQLVQILFDRHFLDNLKERNQDQYNLDGLMTYFGQLLINSAPCFTHLKARGIETGFSVVLELEEENSVSSGPSITPALANHGKRSRAALDEIAPIFSPPESNAKRAAVNK